MEDSPARPAAKPLERAVSVAVFREGRSEVLTVRRPEDDEELAGLWGLPAATLGEGEAWSEAVARTGRQKLGVDLGSEFLLAEGEQDRGDRRLRMRLYRAEVVEGEPVVPQPAGGVTQYTTWEWAPPERLAESARRGSLCSRLCLEALERGR